MPTVRSFFQEAVPEAGAVPDAVIAIQAFKLFLDSILTSMFSVQMGVSKKSSGTRSSRCYSLRVKITEDLVDMLMKWRHSGVYVFCDPRIQPSEEEAMENSARYTIHAFFSQESSWIFLRHINYSFNRIMT